MKTIGSATERKPAFELTWSLAESDDKLVLDYRIEAFEEMYVSDRLWDYDRSHKRIPDPFGVYRFVTDDTLRLVFAQAPYPSNIDPMIIFQPLYSRIAAGAVHQRSVELALPVDEYSALQRNVRAPTALERVPRAMLVMCFKLRSEMDADPSPPPNESADSGYIVYNVSQLTSTIGDVSIPVKRRTGYMARFALPGEPPPGPRPEDPPPNRQASP